MNLWVCDRCGMGDDQNTMEVITVFIERRGKVESIGDFCVTCRDSLNDTLRKWRKRKPANSEARG